MLLFYLGFSYVLPPTQDNVGAEVWLSAQDWPLKYEVPGLTQSIPQEE